ncbi:MAG: hypothetical protein COV44_02400 [Deltaproteobacteria bacterium CG11_big_fil_rev_8_21_14_0_20_45_16]|nr:MAG: hypothetical protein COV44_02400 [Deltaproteobacteria bacterium CG11_big_fil_rev_8_21_14_0_20_45_16]
MILAFNIKYLHIASFETRLSLIFVWLFKLRFPILSAFKESLWEGYSISRFFKDVQAGLVVAAVAIPLGMALGIASGVSPAQGLYTVVVGGFIVAFLGGSRFQVTGPTAAFVVLLLPIVKDHGLGGPTCRRFFCWLHSVCDGPFRARPTHKFYSSPRYNRIHFGHSRHDCYASA